MAKIVLLWLDAFSSRYISNDWSPFLSSTSKNRYATINPLFAYMSINDCFETGVSINRHEIWNDHIFVGFDTEQKRLSSLFPAVVNLVDKFSPNDEINKVLRFVAFKLNNVSYATPHLIPANLIGTFPVIWRDKKWPSIYDLLREHKLKCARYEPKLTFTENNLLRNIPKMMTRLDGLFVKLNSLDRLGHKYSPNSINVRNRVKYFDKAIRRLLKEMPRDTTLIIMSDHGMTPISKTINIMGCLSDNDFEFGRHYAAFVGATYVSFWFKNDFYKQRILSLMSSLDIGHFLTAEERVNAGIDKVGRAFGEEIFVAKEHEVFFPEFYHRRAPPKGMHGFASCAYDAPVFMIYDDLFIELKEKTIDFVDIMPTILKLLHLPIPQHADGKPAI